MGKEEGGKGKKSYGLWFPTFGDLSFSANDILVS